MTESDLRSLGFNALSFASGSLLTLSFGVASGYPEWTSAMLAVSFTCLAIFVIMFVWELGVPFWRGLTGKPTAPLPRREPGRSMPEGAVRPPPSNSRLYYMAIAPNGEWLPETIRTDSLSAAISTPPSAPMKAFDIVAVYVWRK
jgi:hypothetical protein